MADDDYQKKLEALQRYIPFLENMMTELKAKGNRHTQLTKIQSLHDMISDKRKKLKVETLKRCEEVLANIYYKVNPQMRSLKNQPLLDSPKNLPGIEICNSTPASPSPPRDIVLLPTRPVSIPMEKVLSPSKGTTGRNSPKSSRPKINVYSNVVISKARPVAPANIPDMSKPPISLDDLKTLEDDVHQKITDATYVNQSIDQLHETKKQLELQLKVNAIGESSEKSKEDSNHLVSSSKVRLKTPTSPKREGKSPIRHKSNKDQSEPVKVKHYKEADIFGDTLSSIDSKLLEERKKTKKHQDRRLSNSKEENCSSTSLSSHKADGDGKKSSTSTKLRTSSEDRHKKKDKNLDTSKERSKSAKTENASNETSSDRKQLNSSSKDKEETPNKSLQEVLSIIKCLPATTKDDLPKSEQLAEVISSSTNNKSEECKKIDNILKATEPTFKRLADKYNPKPKPKTDNDTDVDKTVTDIIENQMKISPVKALPVSTLVLSDPRKPVQLPDIIQKIFSKPLLGDIIPKNLTEPINIPLNSPPSINQPRQEIPPKPLNFQPPPFVSPPHLPEPIINSPLPMRGPVVASGSHILPRPGIPLHSHMGSLESRHNTASFGTPRMDFDSPGTPLMDFQSPRVDFDQPNQFLSYMPPMIEPQMQGFHRNNSNFMPQGRFPMHQNINMYNPYDLSQGPAVFYGPNHPQPELHHQGFYQERSRWNDRRPGDPRNYREHKEMKERQEREARAAQEKMRDRDPRLSVRDFQTEKLRDPRSGNDTNQDTNKTTVRDPRLSRNKDKIVERTNDSCTRSHGQKEGRAGELKSKEPKSKIETSKFDKMYSKANKDEEEETFLSPLDSLYNAGEKGRTGRGYGVQNFKIPRKTRFKKGNQNEEIKEEIQNSRSKKIVVLESDSEDSDTNVPDTANDNDIEEMDMKIDDKEESLNINEPKVETDSVVSGIDVSRIKVVIKDKEDSDAIWDAQMYNLEDFVSEYDREFQTSESEKSKENLTVMSEVMLKPADEVKQTADDSSGEANETEKRHSEKDEFADKVIETKKTDEIKETVEADTESSQCSENFDDSLKDRFKKPVEADSSKRGDRGESSSKGDEPSEQNILAHFFENLLKSKNKRDKKSALFSLIETFSDSFEDKEIKKIRKIIKVSDDENEGSDVEQDEPRPTDGFTQEHAEVGSTTQEVDEKETDINITATSATIQNDSLTGETQVNEISKSSEELDSLKGGQDSVSIAVEEPVMVSVGERIKNRKRNITKPKKKIKSELDLLHEDIKDMFIRDGVLTANGKRMCRLLKNDPSALDSSNQSSTTSLISEQPKKLRKRPGPKSKLNVNSETNLDSIKDIRIIIKKIPDNAFHTSTPTRRLRNRNSKSSYAEIDDEVLEDCIDAESGVSFYAGSTKSDGEESSEESEELEKTSENVDIPKPKVKRRKVPRWNSGIITKKKKKLPQIRSKENSPERAETPAEDESHNSLGDLDIEPDKDYYYDYINKQKLKCKLCDHSAHALAGHYLKEHPESEVLSSRISSEIAKEAIKDFNEYGTKFEKLTQIKTNKRSSRYHFSCRMCGYQSLVTPLFFYEHLTTHTGEYRHQCGICNFLSVTSKTMSAHNLTVHPNEEKKLNRTSYNLPVVFGYICGECNFLQLNEKAVRDHANIFHLGDQARIYKINMSKTLDPVLWKDIELEETDGDATNDSNILPEKPVTRRKPGPKSKMAAGEDIVEEQVEEGHTGTSLNESKSNDNVLENIPDNDESISLPVKRRKPGPKSKVAARENVTEEQIEEEHARIPSNDDVSNKICANNESINLPVKRRKPGPKSKVATRENPTDKQIDNEKIKPVLRKKPGPKSKTMPVEQDVNSISEDIASEKSHVAASGRRKPGPKSKTQKQPTDVLSLSENKEPSSVASSEEVTKDASTRKRRRSVDKLISEDSGDDLDTIITLSSRSNRAAKDKATAKLKTLMENNEGISSKKKSDVTAPAKNKDPEGGKEISIDTNRDSGKTIDPKVIQNKVQEDEVSHENIESIKSKEAEEQPLNVFTCGTDIIQEDAKKIEEDRLRQMDELNKSIGARTLKLDFINKLCNRLHNEDESQNEVAKKIKDEPKDADSNIDPRPNTPVMPLLERQILEPIIKTQASQLGMSPIVNKKHLLEAMPVQQTNISFRQNKCNSLFSNMIEKLQGKVNEAAVQEDNALVSDEPKDSDGNDVSSQKSITISLGNLIKVTKSDNEIIYSCHANKCYVATKDKMVFQLHCKFGHKDLDLQSTLCEKCGVVVEITKDTTLLENLYDHLMFAHSDFLLKSPLVRMRRMSGDKLSIKQECETALKEADVASRSAENFEAQDFESCIQPHHVISNSQVAASPTTTNTSSEVPAEGTAASEATLEFSEDNPFSFKISSVMSLAKSDQQSPVVSPSKRATVKDISLKPLPLLKQVPPLTLVGTAPKPQAAKGQPMIVKEARMSTAELSRPKKAPKALQKFIESPGDLYKCPHYYCMFSTNIRPLLTCHLKAHKCDSATMVPCVYCEMKTPWEHVGMHIDIRHANSQYSCSLCLYRAVIKEYVALHQEQYHPESDYKIIVLPAHKAATKFSTAEAKMDYKTLCEPYRCSCKNSEGVLREYLFESEFTHHLQEKHINEVMPCGYPGCNVTILFSPLNHWHIFHGVCTYQCSYCKTSSRQISRMFTHFSQNHQHLQPDILVRKNEFLPQDRELGFSDRAFAELGHITKVPPSFLSSLCKRTKHSINLIKWTPVGVTSEETVSSSPEESVISYSYLPAGVENLPHSQSPQLIINNPNMQLIVASTSGNNEKLYLLPASLVSPGSKSITSVAGSSKSIAKTSTISNVVFEPVPKEAVKMGGITLYPQDNSAVDHPVVKASGDITTSSTSHSSSVHMLSQSPVTINALPVTTSVSSSYRLSTGVTANVIDVPVPESSQENETNTSSPDLICNEQIENDQISDDNSAVSRDDILQTAIQSILDNDDSNTSGTRLTFTDADFMTATSESNSSSHPPPPLVLINTNSTISAEPTTDLSNIQLQIEKTPEAAPLEHIELVGAQSFELELNLENEDPLNLGTNEESIAAAAAFFSNNSLDALFVDPMTILPTLNSDLCLINAASQNNPATAIESIAALADPELRCDSNQSYSKTTDLEGSLSVTSNSDEESSDSSYLEKRKSGLIGYQLFRCFGCNLSFSNFKGFKTHLISSSNCKGAKGYTCAHCDKIIKTPFRLAEHIMTHGVRRFSCSLCNEKFALVPHAKHHMRSRHSINQVNMVPLRADQNNLDTDMFVMKPCQAYTPVAKDKEATSESPKIACDDCTYMPDQISIIPIRQIFSSNVKCGLCNYQTKVRVNIIRHLQMHLEEKAVSDIAPVNPVPCLEKNEKMFDKMINFAASSITSTSSRMGGTPGKEKEKEEETYPEFVPSHRRFVCCAQGCSYLCPEEANLKHHLMALHSDENNFTCAHCKVKIEPTDIEHVIKHFKLHGLHLYKCQYCSFVHYLKHKVEKHVGDRHLDSVVKVVTIRYMESEPQEFTPQEESTPQLVAPKVKPWNCCMCKAKYYTEEDVKGHIVKKHNIDARYKCALCSFKNNEEEKCRDHFKEKHPGNEFDIILVYQKLEDEVPQEESIIFDTTPLWQRDKPRVRHIRGILFDESTPPAPAKSPKKLRTYPAPKSSTASQLKTNSNSNTTPSSSPSLVTKIPPSSSGNVTPKPTTVVTIAKDLFSGSVCGYSSERSTKNLVDCIDAVARGTAETLQTKSAFNIEISPIKENSAPLEEPSLDKKSDQATSAIDDDVVIIPQAPNVIVIDSEESDSENAAKDVSLKAGKIRGRKRASSVASDLLNESIKIAKIEESSPDEDQSMADSCSKDNLIKIFGEFGSPHNKQWKCPKCKQFKSKRVADFMFHLYKDFNSYRYKCIACGDLSITYKYMQDHIKLHPGFTEKIIELLPTNHKLNTWVHMVIREQSVVILKNSPLFKKRPLTGPTDIQCYFCHEKFMSMAECCEHMLYHWVMMPYQCPHCPHEFYTVWDLKHHHKVEHPDAKLYTDPKGATLDKAMRCIENTKKRPLEPSAETTGVKKIPRLEINSTETKSSSNVETVNSDSKPILETAEPIINIEDDEDLVIVSKTDDKVPNEDDVFACDLCAFVTETESLVANHLSSFHGVITSKFHVLSKRKSETETKDKLACNICDKLFPELKLRRHFLDRHKSDPYCPYRFKCGECSSKFLQQTSLKLHFTRTHPGLKISYSTVLSSMGHTRRAKRKRQFCPLCTFSAIGTTVNVLRKHLIHHIQPIKCNICEKVLTFHREMTPHNSKHLGLEPSYTVDEDAVNQYANYIKIIYETSILITEEEEEKEKKQSKSESQQPNKFQFHFAKKSTSVFSCSKSVPVEQEEYSYYGIPQEPINLKNVTTTFELDDLEYTTTAEQMLKMFNMDTYVDVSDCAVNLLTLD